MYFSSRHALGKTLAAKIAHLRGKEPIVIALGEQALSTAISVASEVRGWVYPLLMEPVIIPGDDRIIGVINQDGTLCYNPELSVYEREDIEMNSHSVIQEASRQAYSKLNMSMAEYGNLSKDALRGRDIVIIGDVIRDQLGVGAVTELLKTVATGNIVSLVGNITPGSSTALYMESSESTFLDVIPYLMEEAHYFEQPEPYTPTEQRQLAMNISQFWV